MFFADCLVTMVCVVEMHISDSTIAIKTTIAIKIFCSGLVGPNIITL